jgi:hypothetical protein
MSDEDRVAEYHRLFECRGGKLYWKTKTSNKVTVGFEAGGETGLGYRSVSVNGKRTQAHRVVYEMHHGPIPEGLFIDHINVDGLDNRIENLRLATRTENNQNLKLFATNTSGVKNVYWNKAAGKWQVSLRAAGRRMYFGIYDDLELAELVAHEAREKYHGDFANHGVKG